MLPFDPDDPLSRALRSEAGGWRDAAQRVARSVGVEVDRFEPFPDGGALVAAVAEGAVVKLVQPPFHAEAASERWALERLGGHDLGVAIPELLGHGEGEGWRWLVLSRVPGVPLSAVWSGCVRAEREDLCRRIGETMAAVARVPLDDPPTATAEWRELLARLRARCETRHRDLGMPAWFVDGLEGFLAAEADGLDGAFEPILLTGEYTPFNLHVARRGERWELVGMLDFGDAFAGPAEYDLVGPGVFLAAGDPGLLAHLCEGRGWVLDGALARRLHALHLLHRFSDFAVQVALEGWADGVETHDALVDRLWPRTRRVP